MWRLQLYISRHAGAILWEGTASEKGKEALVTRALVEAILARWHVEDDTFRGLKEGWAFEKYPWGRHVAIVRGRIALLLDKALPKLYDACLATAFYLLPGMYISNSVELRHECAAHL